MRSVRMVVTALLHDLINLEEKRFKEIEQSLKNYRNPPTGKLWVDCFILPTFLASHLLRA